jgi:hypothetical protein
MRAYPRIRTCLVPPLDEVGLSGPVFVRTFASMTFVAASALMDGGAFIVLAASPPPPPRLHTHTPTPLRLMLQEGGAAGNVIYVLGKLRLSMAVERVGLPLVLSQTVSQST